MGGVRVPPLGIVHPAEVAVHHHGQVNVEGPPQLQEVAERPTAETEHTHTHTHTQPNEIMLAS